MNALGSQIIREIVIPALTKEVNEGKNFTQLRQVYNSLILAVATGGKAQLHGGAPLTRIGRAITFDQAEMDWAHGHSDDADHCFRSNTTGWSSLLKRNSNLVGHSSMYPSTLRARPQLDRQLPDRATVRCSARDRGKSTQNAASWRRPP